VTQLPMLLLPKIRAVIDQHIFVPVNICVGCQQ